MGTGVDSCPGKPPRPANRPEQKKSLIEKFAQKTGGKPQRMGPTTSFSKGSKGRMPLLEKSAISAAVGDLHARLRFKHPKTSGKMLPQEISRSIGFSGNPVWIALSGSRNALWARFVATAAVPGAS
jgi:hypothetical protein